MPLLSGLQGRDRAHSVDDQGQPRLARSVALQVPRNRGEKTSVGQECLEFLCDKCPHVVGSAAQVVNELGPSIDELNDVLQVVARAKISCSTPAKGLQLGGDGERSADDREFSRSNLVLLTVGDRGAIPAV